MKRIKMILAAVVAVMAIGAMGASAASAGTVTGTISGTAAGNTVGPCDFTASTTGTLPGTVTVNGASFAGAGSTQPCDTSTLSVTNFTATHSGSHVLTLGAFNVTAEVDLPIFGPTDCTFPVSSGSVVLTGAALNGPYSGGGSSNGSNCIVSANLSVSNLVVS